jgi:hypothetical protein
MSAQGHYWYDRHVQVHAPARNHAKNLQSSQRYATHSLDTQKNPADISVEQEALPVAFAQQHVRGFKQEHTADRLGNSLLLNVVA